MPSLMGKKRDYVWPSMFVRKISGPEMRNILKPGTAAYRFQRSQSSFKRSFDDFPNKKRQISVKGENERSFVFTNWNWKIRQGYLSLKWFTGKRTFRVHLKEMFLSFWKGLNSNDSILIENVPMNLNYGIFITSNLWQYLRSCVI